MRSPFPPSRWFRGPAGPAPPEAEPGLPASELPGKKPPIAEKESKLGFGFIHRIKGLSAAGQSWAAKRDSMSSNFPPMVSGMIFQPKINCRTIIRLKKTERPRTGPFGDNGEDP